MPTPEIIQRVRALRNELSAQPNASADLVRELDTILIEPEVALRYARLSDKLLAVEALHPKLSASIQQLVEMLTSVGL